MGAASFYYLGNGNFSEGRDHIFVTPHPSESHPISLPASDYVTYVCVLCWRVCMIYEAHIYEEARADFPRHASFEAEDLPSDMMMK